MQKQRAENGLQDDEDHEASAGQKRHAQRRGNINAEQQEKGGIVKKRRGNDSPCGCHLHVSGFTGAKQSRQIQENQRRPSPDGISLLRPTQGVTPVLDENPSRPTQHGVGSVPDSHNLLSLSVKRL